VTRGRTEAPKIPAGSQKCDPGDFLNFDLRERIPNHDLRSIF
jgi:hypothetical protein